VNFKLDKETWVLSIYGDFIFLNKNWNFHVYVCYRADTTTTIYMYIT
jgi:hypothetical protein